MFVYFTQAAVHKFKAGFIKFLIRKSQSGHFGSAVGCIKTGVKILKLHDYDK